MAGSPRKWVVTTGRRVAAGLALALLAGPAACGAPEEAGAPLNRLVADPVLAGCVADALGLADVAATPTGDQLAGLQGLADLDVSDNAIIDVSPLTGMPSLDTLRLSRNQVADAAPLGTIPTLLVLDVFGNAITDVTGLSDAPLLQELQLGANPVTDLTPLLDVASLVNLGLDETDGSLLTGVEELRAAGVSVNGLA